MCARGRVAEVVALDGSYADFPNDPNVSVVHLRGMKEREGAMIVRSAAGTTAVFNDAILNMKPGGGMMMGFFLAPLGRLSIPRYARWMLIKDRGELRGHLDEIAQTSGLERVIVGHGDTVNERASEALSNAAAELS